MVVYECEYTVDSRDIDDICCKNKLVIHGQD